MPGYTKIKMSERSEAVQSEGSGKKRGKSAWKKDEKENSGIPVYFLRSLSYLRLFCW